jgi:hypothetical protein
MSLNKHHIEIVPRDLISPKGNTRKGHGPEGLGVREMMTEPLAAWSAATEAIVGGFSPQQIRMH